MSTLAGLRFPRSILTLSSAALSSGGKSLTFFMYDRSILRRLCFPSELADCLESEDKSKVLSVSNPNSLFTGSTDWQSLETFELWVRRFKTSKKHNCFKLFLSIKTVAIVSYRTSYLPKNSVARIDDDLEKLCN